MLAALGSDYRPATDDEIRGAFGAGGGSLGPVGVEVEVVADEALREGQFVAGANRDGWHLLGVEAGRDYEPRFADIREPNEGDTCPNCGGAAPLPDCDRGRAHLQVRRALLGAARCDVPGRGRHGEAADRRELRGRAGAGHGRGRRAVPRRERDRLAFFDRAVRRPRAGAARRGGGGSRPGPRTWPKSWPGLDLRFCSTTATSARERSSPTPISSAARRASSSGRRRSTTERSTYVVEMARPRIACRRRTC